MAALLNGAGVVLALLIGLAVALTVSAFVLARYRAM